VRVDLPQAAPAAGEDPGGHAAAFIDPSERPQVLPEQDQ
jgi:hypothetical protein